MYSISLVFRSCWWASRPAATASTRRATPPPSRTARREFCTERAPTCSSTRPRDRLGLNTIFI